MKISEEKLNYVVDLIKYHGKFGIFLKVFDVILNSARL